MLTREKIPCFSVQKDGWGLGTRLAGTWYRDSNPMITIDVMCEAERSRVALIFPFIACGGSYTIYTVVLTTHTNVPFQ